MNILLVEDDIGIGRFVRRGLSMRGYEVVTTREGLKAVDLLRSGNFAALILDRGLPDCDGLDLCRQLRDAAIRVPIIMLSARGTLQDRLDGFECGADDYLPKPFAFDELAARLSAITRRVPDPASEPVRFWNLVLDPRGRTARVEDRPLSLSPREFDLLAALARAGGTVVTRQKLLAGVWGGEAEVSDNVLDVYIGYLRRHLGRNEGAPSIETQRGQGFRLAPGAYDPKIPPGAGI